MKYRKDDACGGGLAAITPEKRRQMEFAAEMFREQNSELSSKQPLLAVAEVTGKDYVVKEWFTLVF